MHDPRGHARRADVQHHELEESVVEQDAIANADVVRELGVGDGNLAWFLAALVDEHDVGALHEHDRRIQVADTDPWSLKIAHYRDRDSDFLRYRANVLDENAMLIVRAVGEVQPGDVEARFHEAFELLAGRRCRAERTDDLGAALMTGGHDFAVRGCGEAFGIFTTGRGVM